MHVIQVTHDGSVRPSLNRFVEKPVAPTYLEARGMADLAAARGLVAVGGHNRRFYPAFDALRTDLCKLHYDQTIMRDPAWAQPQMPADDEKRSRRQLEDIGAVGVHYVRGCQLWIEMWSSGLGRDTAYKKFRYGPPMFRIIEVKEPPPKDLNTYIETRVRISSFQKKIDGDWWIEIDHWL